MEEKNNSAADINCYVLFSKLQGFSSFFFLRFYCMNNSFFMEVLSKVDKRTNLNFAVRILFGYQHTRLEKQSKFPRYNMKRRGKPDTT